MLILSKLVSLKGNYKERYQKIDAKEFEKNYLLYTHKLCKLNLIMNQNRDKRALYKRGDTTKRN